jgi:hypothetical protein
LITRTILGEEDTSLSSSFELFHTLK